MAVEVLTDVINKAPKNLTKLEYQVLYCVADNANADERINWTRVEALARWTKADVEDVEDALRVLQERGIIEPVPDEEMPTVLQGSANNRRVTTPDNWR